MVGAQLIEMLDHPRRQPFIAVVNQRPLSHPIGPVPTCAVKVGVNLGDRACLVHLARSVALVDRLGAEPQTVALEVAIAPVSSHRLEIRAEGVVGEVGEPGLELGPFLFDVGKSKPRQI